MFCQQRNSHIGLKRNPHPELSLAYSPPTMAAKRLNLPSVPSTVASLPLSDAPLPTPAKWWHRPSSLRLSFARDDNDGSGVHRCSLSSCCCVLVVMLMLVVVLLLSVVPSRRRTTNVQRPMPSPRPPPLPLPSQSHLLQLSPPPSPRCHFHRRCRRGYHPAAASTTRIPSTQLSLAVAITTATAVVNAITGALAAAIDSTISLASAVTIAAASTDVSARARLAVA